MCVIFVPQCSCVQAQVPLDQLRAAVAEVEQDHSCERSLQSDSLADSSSGGSGGGGSDVAAVQRRCAICMLGFQWCLRVSVEWSEETGGVVCSVCVVRQQPFHSQPTGAPTRFTLSCAKSLQENDYDMEAECVGITSDDWGFCVPHASPLPVSSTEPDLGLGFDFVRDDELWLKLHMKAIG